MCAGRGWGTGEIRYIFSIGNLIVKQHISFKSVTLRCFESGKKAHLFSCHTGVSNRYKIKVMQTIFKKPEWQF